MVITAIIVGCFIYFIDWLYDWVELSAARSMGSTFFLGCKTKNDILNCKIMFSHLDKNMPSITSWEMEYLENLARNGGASKCAAKYYFEQTGKSYNRRCC